MAGLGRPGPEGIWLCPSTTSLREEARANLEAMGRPKLWHCPSGSAVREAAREELAYLQDRFKAAKKVVGSLGDLRFASRQRVSL